MRYLWKSAHIVNLGSLCYKLSKKLICNDFPNSKPRKLDRNEMNTIENIMPNKKQGRCSRAEMQNDQGKKGDDILDLIL